MMRCQKVYPGRSYGHRGTPCRKAATGTLRYYALGWRAEHRCDLHAEQFLAAAQPNEQATFTRFEVAQTQNPKEGA